MIFDIGTGYQYRYLVHGTGTGTGTGLVPVPVPVLVPVLHRYRYHCPFSFVLLEFTRCSPVLYRYCRVHWGGGFRAQGCIDLPGGGGQQCSDQLFSMDVSTLYSLEAKRVDSRRPFHKSLDRQRRKTVAY